MVEWNKYLQTFKVLSIETKVPFLNHCSLCSYVSIHINSQNLVLSDGSKMHFFHILTYEIGM